MQYSDIAELLSKYASKAAAAAGYDSSTVSKDKVLYSSIFD
jgi:hypothetical protein